MKGLLNQRNMNMLRSVYHIDHPVRTFSTIRIRYAYMIIYGAKATVPFFRGRGKRKSLRTRKTEVTPVTFNVVVSLSAEENQRVRALSARLQNDPEPRTLRKGSVRRLHRPRAVKRLHRRSRNGSSCPRGGRDLGPTAALLPIGPAERIDLQQHL